MRARYQRIMKNILMGVVVSILLFVTLIPIYFMFITSLKTPAEIYHANTLWPHTITIDNYLSALGSPFGFLHGGEFSTWFPLQIRNSLIVSLSTMMISLAIAILAAFSLSEYDIKFKTYISYLMLIVYMFPGILIAIPLYDIYSKIGLIDSLFGLVLIDSAYAIPFCAWLMQAFFASVPTELKDAAHIDGASPSSLLLRILLPLVTSGVATCALFALLTAWNEYLFAQMLILNDSNKTLPLGIAMFMQYQKMDWGATATVTILSIIPILVIFLPISRHFLKGVREGALKL